MSRHLERNRKYSIVIHDVVEEDDPKGILKTWVLTQTPTYYMIALEAYNHQEGHHMHLFIEFKNVRSKFKLLKELQKLFTGRIQVDVGRGSYEECQKYLTDPDKEKNVDTNILQSIGVPKIRLHNHSDRYNLRSRKNCPRCSWIQYFRKLEPWKCFIAEMQKPYEDYNRVQDLPQAKLKYW